MAKEKKEVSEAVEAAEEKVGAKALAVFSDTGQYIRTYSAEIHGPDFKALAEQFAGKVKGREVRKA